MGKFSHLTYLTFFGALLASSASIPNVSAEGSHPPLIHVQEQAPQGRSVDVPTNSGTFRVTVTEQGKIQYEFQAKGGEPVQIDPLKQEEMEKLIGPQASGEVKEKMIGAASRIITEAGEQEAQEPESPESEQEKAPEEEKKAPVVQEQPAEEGNQESEEKPAQGEAAEAEEQPPQGEAAEAEEQPPQGEVSDVRESAEPQEAPESVDQQGAPEVGDYQQEAPEAGDYFEQQDAPETGDLPEQGEDPEPMYFD